MCQNRSISGTCKGVRIRRVSYVTVWFQTNCDPRDGPIDTCRNVDFTSGRVMPSFLIRA